MKKLTSILFSFIYLIASVGVAVNIHYCSGQLESVQLLATNGDCCCEDRKKTKSCCADETYFFQLDQEQQVPQNFRILPDLLLTGIVHASSAPVSIEILDYKTNLPIRDWFTPQNQPLWLLNCSLTFYG